MDVRRIDLYYLIDEQHLYIEATGNTHFLFTLRRKCRGLRRGRGFAVIDTMNRVCNDGFSKIVVQGMGKSLESCRIDTIDEVASQVEAIDLIKDRKETGRD